MHCRQTIDFRGVLHHVDGCEGSTGVMLTRLLLLSDSQFRCPHFPFTDFFFFALISCHYSPLVTSFFHLCLWWHLLSDYLSINTCRHMCSQLLITNTAKHHRITSRLLSETHVVHGVFFDPKINIKNNENIMFLIMSAEKIMNNNGKKQRKVS